MINDSILNDPLFADKANEEDGFYDSVEQRLSAIGVSLPEFFTFEPAKERRVIVWNPEAQEYTTEGPDGVGYSWERLSNAYREIEHMGFDADFDESVLSSPDVESSLGTDMIFMKPEREGAPSAELLIGPVNNRGIQYYHYYSFLQTAKTYLEESSDFLRSYQFLRMHPAFWTRPDAERNPYYWNTDGGVSSASLSVTQDDKGNVVICLEHGAAVPPERTMRYHDPRLDVYAPTFEQAIIDLAAETHKYFALDGDERPDVDYTPQPWEVEVAKRLDSYKGSMKADD